MDAYLDRARAALAGFGGALDDFEQGRSRLVPGPGLTVKQVDRLRDIAERLRQAVARLEHSLRQIEVTGLDVVDLQARLEGEAAALAAALSALGETLEKAPVIASSMGATLFALEEHAERVAAGIFPNAIEGLREINRTLWDFRPLWNDYARTLATEVARTGQRRLTADQIAAVERTAEQVRARFDAVNELLNQLATTPPSDGAGVKTVVREARHALSDAIRQAKSKAADAYKPFHGVLKRAERLAGKIDEQFAKLRVPVFPDVDRLEDLQPIVDSALYARLGGVERFALLNIGSRLRSVLVGPGANEHLLAARFAIRIFDVFPDRVYFTADAAFIETVNALKTSGVFEDAPASLHRFNEGSVKQRQLKKGNLQLSYASGSPERPDDRTKVRVDADIDLYRSPVRHLFGEVLVNHLTGSKTDQFKVWDTLVTAEVVPLGGFAVVSV
jgi:hypothetical protein